MSQRRMNLLWQLNPIFAAAGERATQRLAETYPTRELPAETVIFELGQAAQELHVLLSGTVRVYHRAPDGREISVKLLRAPSVFGDIELFCTVPLLENVAAVDEVLLATIPAADYQAFLAKHPAAVMAHLKHLAAAFCVAARSELQVFSPLEQRIANLLCTYGDLFGEVKGGKTIIERHFAQTDVAQALGVVRRSVVAVFGRWRRAGLVSRYNDRLVLEDVAELERLAGPLRGSLRYEMGMSLDCLSSRTARVGAEIIFSSGPLAQKGRRQSFERELVIGRLPPSQVCIPDEEVSPQHCRIFLAATGGKYWVEDLDSLNGTVLGERAVRRAVLKDGDCLRLGATRLNFRTHSFASESELPVP